MIAGSSGPGRARLRVARRRRSRTPRRRGAAQPRGGGRSLPRRATRRDPRGRVPAAVMASPPSSYRFSGSATVFTHISPRPPRDAKLGGRMRWRRVAKSLSAPLVQRESTSEPGGPVGMNAQAVERLSFRGPKGDRFSSHARLSPKARLASRRAKFGGYICTRESCQEQAGPGTRSSTSPQDWCVGGQAEGLSDVTGLRFPGAVPGASLPFRPV